jgi:E3 ubiquitin-protein ligase DOA10
MRTIKPLMRRLNYTKNMSNIISKYSKEEPKEDDTCRLCFDVASEDPKNPLISICKCKGTINNIHLNCLKVWLENKLTTKEIQNKMGISYTIKSFNCELCKEPYPSTYIPNQ